MARLDAYWAVLDAEEPILTAHGWRRIDPDVRTMLKEAGLLVPGPRATHARCPACAVAHIEPVIERPGKGGVARHFVRCPVNRRVRVTAADLETWRADPTRLARAITAAASLSGGIRATGSDRLYWCGHYDHHGVRVDVYFARGLGREDGASIAARLPGGAFAPIVLVPQRIGDEIAWPGDSPIVIPLPEITSIEGTELTIDHRLLRQAAAKLTDKGQAAPNQFRRVGEFWDLAFEGSGIKHFADSVGLAYLVRLLAEPHQSIAAVSLLASRVGIDPRIPTGSSGEALDDQGRRELRERYRDLMQERAEAESMNDLARQTNVASELDALTVELNHRLGQGGRSRQTTDADRVRRSVSMAVSREIERIAKQLPQLGTHLTAAISSGQFFKYAPDREIDWVI